MYLTGKEIQIMWVFWKSTNPLTAAEIYEKVYDGKKTRSATYIIMNSLKGKKLIREIGQVRCGKTFSKTYLPAISCSDYFEPILSSVKAYFNLFDFLTYFIAACSDKDTLLDLSLLFKSVKKEIIIERQ